MIYLTLYLGVAFGWRSWRVYRRTGINPFVLGNSDSAHDFVGRVFKLVTLALVVDVFLFAFWPKAHAWVRPIDALDRTWIDLAGVLSLATSWVWIVVAQAQMGNAWRIGIDHEHKTELVSSGVFSISRNPIFLGMRFSLLGFFLVMPDTLTLTVLILGEVLIQIQVRLEEAHLEGLHGEAYRRYRQEVRRWL